MVKIKEMKHASYKPQGNAEYRWLFFDNLFDLRHYSLGCDHFFRVYSMNSFLDLDFLLCFVVLFPAILILPSTLWIVSQERNYQLLSLSVLSLYRIPNIPKMLWVIHVLVPQVRFVCVWPLEIERDWIYVTGLLNWTILELLVDYGSVRVLFPQ